MDCSQFRGAYSDFVDGLLDERDEVARFRHLAECRSCRRFHEAVQWGAEQLRRQPQVLPSGDFRDRLERRLRAGPVRRTPAARAWSSAAATLMGFTVAAAALFAFDVVRARPTTALFAGDPPPIIPTPFAPVARSAGTDVVARALLRFEASGDSFAVQPRPHPAPLAARISR